VLNEVLLLKEVLVSPTQDCDISLCFWSLEGCRFEAEDSEDGVLSTVGSVDRVLEAQVKRGHRNLPPYCRTSGPISSSGVPYRICKTHFWDMQYQSRN